MIRPRLILGLTWIGRGLFLAGIFLMVTGDWPRSTLLTGSWWVPLRFLAWPWLYLTLLGASFVVLLSSGALRVTRPTAADFLQLPIALLTAAFLLSVVLSQIPSLSWWAFGCVIAVVVFSLAVARIVEDETAMAGTSIAIAAAAFFLAVRVLMWRLDEGLTVLAYHIGNTAWLGKIQISWVLNLLAPLLLGRFLVERAIGAILFYAGAWLLTGAAIYSLSSRAGILAFTLTTVSLCALNAHIWRRWVPVLAVCIGLAVGVIAVSTTISTYVVTSLRLPRQDGSLLTRQSVVRQSIRMIVDHPVVGIGLGTYDHLAYTHYGPVAEPWFFRNGWHAHNTPLHILAETGAVGFLAWCYLWFTIVRFLLRRRRDGERHVRLNSTTVLGVLLAFFVLSMTEAVTAARLYASLRMNLTVALLVMYGIRLASRTAGGDAIPLPRP